VAFVDITLTAYSRGGGCGFGPPVRICPSTFPFDPQVLCTGGEPCPLCVRLCACACKVESGGAASESGRIPANGVFGGRVLATENQQWHRICAISCG